MHGKRKSSADMWAQATSSCLLSADPQQCVYAPGADTKCCKCKQAIAWQVHNKCLTSSWPGQVHAWQVHGECMAIACPAQKDHGKCRASAWQVLRRKIYLHTYIYVQAFRRHLGLTLFVCLLVCLFVCLFVCLCVCVCVCVCLYTCFHCMPR